MNKQMKKKKKKVFLPHPIPEFCLICGATIIVDEPLEHCVICHRCHKSMYPTIFHEWLSDIIIKGKEFKAWIKSVKYRKTKV